MAASSIGKKPQGGMLPCERLRNLARERNLRRLLQRRKATVGADLNMAKMGLS